MKIRLKIFLSTIIFSLVPFLSWGEQIETKIKADKITIENGEILHAEGAVEVKHGAVIFQAHALRFNKKSNKIELTDIQEFYDGNTIRLVADEADLNSDLSEGIIRTATLLLEETIKIQTNEVRFKDGEIYSAEGISRVTSCDECEGKQPNWYLTASSAKRDVENSNIVYKNVTVRLKGLPVAYIPYLRMPDPSVDRAIGFLVPEAVLTSNLATGLKLPYFIPMGLSSDLLVTPYLSSKTNTLEYRYRKKFKNGDLKIDGAFSDDDLIDNDLRYFSQLVGYFKLGYGIDLNFNVGKVGDQLYLGDYVYSEESEFNSKISLGKTTVKKQQFFDGNLVYLREKEQGNSLDEYYSFSGSFLRNLNSINVPGKLRLSANLNSAFNVNDDNSVSRPPSSAQLGISYNQVSFLGMVQFSNDVFGNFNSFVNSADSGTTREEFSLQYGASTLISVPRIKKGKSNVSILKPKISISFNGQANDIVGDYFLGADEPSWGNIYSGRKITSLTESETGFSISLGLDKQFFWDTGKKMEISLAASKSDGLTYTSDTNYGLVRGQLDYLAKFFYQTRNFYTFYTDVIFSNDGQLLKGDVKNKFSHKKIDVKANYEFVDHSTDSRLSADIKNINFSSSYDFLDDFQVSASGRYDLLGNQMATTSFGYGFSVGSWDYNFTQEYLKEEREKFSISAIYDDECTRLTFSFENRYQDVGSSGPVKSLMLRVQLKPFANVVFSQGGDQITF